MTDTKKAAPAKSSPKTSQPDNTIAYELVGGISNAISQAVFVATSTIEQTKAVTTYCDRLDTLFATIDDHSDESFFAEFHSILADAVLILKAWEAGEVQIMHRKGGDV